MTINNNIKSGCSGFSLIELLFTMAIMGIVLGIGTLSFRQWQVKSNIESEIREIFVDLNEARSSAFTQKCDHRIVFQPNSYVMKRYSSENESRSAGRTIVTKNLKYGLTSKSGSNLAADITDRFVEFDSGGITSNLFTVIVNPLSEDVAVNCLVIFETRVNMGKINGSTCEFK